jgi:putative oxidoreductase
MVQVIRKIFETDGKSYTLFFLRVVAALVMFPHGAQKLFGWFGGQGFDATISAFSGYMGIPAFFSVLNILAESVGSILLLVGLFSRISAFGLAVTMIVAVFAAHINHGFFMNWAGTAAGEGFEYHILYFAIVSVILIKGAGAYALDNVIAGKLGGVKKENYKLQSTH